MSIFYTVVGGYFASVILLAAFMSWAQRNRDKEDKP